MATTKTQNKGRGEPFYKNKLAAKGLPSFPDIEAATIAGLIKYGAAAMDSTSLLLIPEHYHASDFRSVFRGIRNLIANGQPTTQEAIGAILTTHGITLGDDTWNRIGEAECMATHFAHYVQRLEDCRRSRLAIEAAMWTLDEGLGIADRDKHWSVDEFISGLEQRVFDIAERKGVESVTGYAIEEMKAMIAVRRTGEYAGGIQTGIAPWDSVLGGIFDSRLYAVVARPGRGKTALLEEIAAQMVNDGHNIVVFQKDMPRSRFIGRIACRLAGQSFYRFERGLLTSAELDAVEGIVDAMTAWEDRFHIYDPVRLTASEIHSIVRREKRRRGIKAWFLDYMQLLDVGDDPRIGLTEASKELKRTINETGVPGIVFAQLNREGANGRPTAANIKEFDQLHADAGAVICLWTTTDPATLQIHEPMRVEFTIDKNNFGPVSDEAVMFDRQLMKFSAMPDTEY